MQYHRSMALDRLRTFSVWSRWLAVVVVMLGCPADRADCRQPSALVRSVVLEEIDAHTLRVHLRVPRLPETTPRLFVQHRTVVANRIAIDSGTAATVELTQQGGWIRFDFPLAAVPEEVLSLGLEPMVVRWEGLGPTGDVVLAAERTVDPLVRRGVELRPWDLFVKYGRVTELGVWPSAKGLQVRATLLLYNPLSFSVIVERLAYRLEISDQQVVEDEHEGLTLASREVTRVPIASTVAVGSALRSGLNAILERPRYRLSCELEVRTPTGPVTLAFSRGDGGATE